MFLFTVIYLLDDITKLITVNGVEIMLRIADTDGWSLIQMVYDYLHPRVDVS